MEWIEVEIFTTREGIEPVSAVLLETGINGIQIEDDDELKEYLAESSMYWDYADEELLNKEKEETRVKIYVSDNPYGQEMLVNVRNAVNRLKSIENEIGINLGRLDIKTTENLNDEDWLNKWREFYKPFEIGDKMIIKPCWEEIENPNNKVVFSINPGHVFGTGLHQTTQFCIKSLEKYVNDESVVLDLGCGSGILSIISLLLGAKSAFAVDIDKNAVKVAYENAELNNITEDKYYVTYGNVIDDKKLQKNIGTEKYDIVLANIIADVICAISPIVPKQLKKDGVLIASGIIRERIEDVYCAFAENNLKVIDTLINGEWVCIIAKREI